MGRPAFEYRATQIRRVLWHVLILNWAVAAAKISLGLWTHSMVIIADGIHSLSDGASNIVGLIGMSIAANPADKSHPYGHRKFETIAAFIISFSLFFASISILEECMRQFFKPVRAEVNALSFVVMGLTLVVNGGVAWWEKRKSRELKSDLLAADAFHTFSDVFVTLSVLLALAGLHFGLKRLDTIVALGIALFIAWIAVRILINSSHVLADHSMIDASQIHSIVMKIDGVEDCHEIRSRGRPDDTLVDLHILVDPKMSVAESHQLANIIERDIRLVFEGVTEVLIHIEPTDHDHTELENLS